MAVSGVCSGGVSTASAKWQRPGAAAPRCEPSSLSAPMSTPTASRPHRREDEFTGERHVFVPAQRRAAAAALLRARGLAAARVRRTSSPARSCASRTSTRSSGSCGWCSTRCCWRSSTSCWSTSSAPAGIASPDFFAHLVARHVRLPAHPERDDGRRQVGHQGRPADPQLGVPARAAAAVGGDHGVHALPADDDRLHPRSTSPSGLPVNAEHAVGDPDPGADPVHARAGSRCSSPPAQVYFRDLSNFLPYMLRIWLYISPVLYFADEVPHALQVAARRQPARGGC